MTTDPKPSSAFSIDPLSDYEDSLLSLPPPMEVPELTSKEALGASKVVADVMEREFRVVTPGETVLRAAQLMRDEDIEILPVGEEGQLIGIITDRDFVLRLVAEARDPVHTRVRDVMTSDVKYVFADEELSPAVALMTEQQVRRAPVVNRTMRLVGLVSLTALGPRGSGDPPPSNENARAPGPRGTGDPPPSAHSGI